MNIDTIRNDFPILGRKVNGKPLIYLDSGATAQKPERVIEAVNRLHREQNANIHRGVHRLSEEATELYEQARERVRMFIGAAQREEVIFTAGATASIILLPTRGAKDSCARAIISSSARWSITPISCLGS